VRRDEGDAVDAVDARSCALSAARIFVARHSPLSRMATKRAKKDSRMKTR
jgi:hypothetical protein